MSTFRARDFWRRMAERIGQRWYDDFGTQPNTEWCALLAKYSDTVLTRFFDAMPAYAHPPTHAMVSHELETIAKRGADDARDHIRAYWRSVVSADLEGFGSLIGLWPRGTRLQMLPSDSRGRVLRFANQLVEELNASECQIGTRTSAMLEHCASTCWNFITRLHGERQLAPAVVARGAA